MKSKIINKIDELLIDDNLSIEIKNKLEEIKKELVEARNEVKVFAIIQIFIRLLTSLFED